MNYIESLTGYIEYSLSCYNLNNLDHSAIDIQVTYAYNPDKLLLQFLHFGNDLKETHEVETSQWQ